MIKINHDYSGILFIGDPHLWSKKPSKRTDESFVETVLDKINQAIEIAIDNNLYPIILGDLFHVDSESDIRLLTKLTKILKKLPYPCSSVEGNHEKSQLTLSEDVALSLLQEAGLLYVLEDNAYQLILNVGQKEVLIGSTPYGSKIPKAPKIPKNVHPDFTFWLTHHNLDFGDSYPGVIKVEEIEGVNILVNGHIHKTKKPLKINNMLAFNPGNIVRLSTDCLEHEPSVWGWGFENANTLVQYKLKYNKESFNLVGSLISETVIAPKMIEEASAIHSSQFVEQMEKQLLPEHDLSSDGGHIKDSIIALSKAMNVSEDITNELLKIADDSIKDLD